MTMRPYMQVICGIHTLRTRKKKVIDPRYRPSKEILQAVGRLEDWLWQELDVPLPFVGKGLGTDAFKSAEIEASRAATLRCYLCNEGGQPKRGDQVLHWNTEWSCPRLIGFKLPDTVFANDVVWALVSRHKAYQNTGVHPLPSAPLNPWYERCLRQYQTGVRYPRNEPAVFHTVNQAKILARNGQHYPYFTDYVPDYLLVTRWLFQWVGLFVRARDLRLMLSVVWS
jgi:hypothetical protein